MNIKKIIAGVVACCVVCGGLPVIQGGFSENATIANAEESEILTYKKTSNGGLEVKSCSKDAVSVEIPDEIEGRKVTGIYYSAFKDCTELESVVIPEGVTSIGREAFAGCVNLKSITIPESVTVIDWNAFKDTAWLENKRAESPFVVVNGMLVDGSTCKGDVLIPDGIKSLNTGAFYECNDIVSVVIPDSVTVIGYNAFEKCENLESVTIPDSVDTIKERAFLGCINLKPVKIPGSLVFIDKFAFYQCESFGTIEIPDSVTTIRESAFANCKNLTSIKIPDSVTSIEAAAFQYCSALESIEISDSVRGIGMLAFCDCSSLKSIKIPNDIILINDSTFSHCTSLETVIIPKSVTTIAYHAFPDCENIKDVYYSGTEEEWQKVRIAGENDCLKNATVHYNYNPEDDGTDVLIGDANGDNAVNIADATAIIQFIANPDKYGLTEKQKKSADVDGEPGITPLDALIIQQIESGKYTPADLPLKK